LRRERPYYRGWLRMSQGYCFLGFGCWYVDGFQAVDGPLVGLAPLRYALRAPSACAYGRVAIRAVGASMRQTFESQRGARRRHAPSARNKK